MVSPGEEKFPSTPESIFVLNSVLILVGTPTVNSDDVLPDWSMSEKKSDRFGGKYASKLSRSSRVRPRRSRMLGLGGDPVLINVTHRSKAVEELWG